MGFRRVSRQRGTSVFLLAATLGLVWSIAPAAAGTARAAYLNACDGSPRDTTDYVAIDVTPQTYWINEVVSIATAIHQYPCQATGSGNGQNDTPFILGANLQYYNSGAGGYIVQLGFSRCEQVCKAGLISGKEMLVWTSSDSSGGVVTAATWWNQGLGLGVLQEGDQYEMAILPYGSQWEYGVRDMKPGGTWTYQLAPNHWPAKSGGNFAWWGTEVWNWQSVMGHRAPDPALNMQSMEWRESDNNSWHPLQPGSCYLNGPAYFRCWIYNGYWLDSWTNDH